MPTGVEIANAYVALQVKMPGVGRDIESSLRGAQSNVAAAGRDAGEAYAGGVERSSSRLGSFFSNIAKTGIAAMGAVAVASGAVGIKTAAGMETAEIAFTTMLQSGEKAQAFLSDLSAFAAKTPFDLPGLQKSAQSLISIGIDANKVIPIMTTLGNVTSGMGTGAEGVQRATVAIQQMNAAGRIGAEDLNQLRDAGIPVFDLLTAATGKTTAEIAEMASKGKLGREELEQLMSALESGKGLERFNGMMEAQSQSLSGLWSTLQDTFSVGMAEAIQPAIPLLKEGLAGAITAVGQALPYVQSGIQWLVDAAPQIQSFFTNAWTGAQGLYSLVVQGDFTGKLTEAFGWSEDSAAVDFILDIRDGIQGIWDLVVNGDFTGQLRNAFGWEEDSGAVTFILDMRDAVKGFFEDLASGDTQGAFDSIGASLSTLSPAFEAAATQMPSFSDGLNVASGVLSFLADNVDTLVAAMPLLVGAFVAFKGAQALSNAIGRDSIVGLGLQVGSTLTLAASNRALAASMQGTAVQGAATNAVENTTLWTRIRTTAATVAQQTATLAAAGAARVAAAGQWLLNAAMSANPVGIVIVAITALVGALVWFFSETEVGRQIWNNFVTNVAGAATWLWENGIRPIVDLVVNYFRLWGAIAVWLWENAIGPTINRIVTGFQGLWTFGIQPVVDLVRGGIQLLGLAFSYLWQTYVQPAIDNISRGLSLLWTAVDQGVLQPFGRGIDNFGRAFSAAWDTMKKAAAVPINFVLETVWNNGLRSFWNDLVQELGLDDMKLPRAEIVKFASGGVMPGYTPGRDVHQFWSPTAGGLALSGGEAIMRPEFTRLVGGAAGVDALNAAAIGGRLPFGDGIGQIAGDVWETITGAASMVWEFLTNPGQAIQKHIIDGIITPLASGENIFGRTVAGLAGNTLKGLADIFPTSSGPAGKGMGWETMWKVVQSAIPGVVKTSDMRPGAITANGGQSYHALGRAIDLIPASMATFNAVAKLFPNASELIYSPAGRRQLLNGQPFDGWSDAVRKQHYNHVHLAMAGGGVIPKLYDQGGWLPHGGMALNLSGRPEPVFTDEQWGLMRRGGGGPALEVHGDLVVADLDEAFRKAEDERRFKQARAGVFV